MSFSSIKTFNFRNLENCEISTESKNIFLLGENGQGKTNFLEAIYCLCFGNSFRTKYDAILLRENEKEMSIKGIYKTNGEKEGELQDINTIFLSVSEGKKKINLNEKKVKDRKEIIYNNPCILFCHDDISFVNGGPEKRRFFFNQTISLFDFNFLDNLRRYEKILKNRNAVLKDGKIDILDIYDKQLVKEGIEITKKRQQTVKEFNETFSPIFSKVSGFDSAIKIIYRPSWPEEETAEGIEKIVASKREGEKVMGTTLSGPHRDRFFFYIDKKDFTKIASTGQIRLISLSLKSAQAEFYKKKTGKKPLVLLDDVLLELDKTRKRRFLDVFPEYEQAFFTFLPGEDVIVDNKEGIYYTVKNGEIRER